MKNQNLKKNKLFWAAKASYIWLILIALLTGCSDQQSPNDLGRLRISFNSYPTTADPRKSGDFLSSTLICMVFDGLSRSLPDGSVELALAKRVEISPDQKTYTFYLRHSLWSDGTPITAYDFERSWKQILDPEFPSVCPYLFYSIQNAKNARNGLVGADQIGIHALDEHTLKVTLERPTPYFLSLTAFPSFLPNPPNADHQFERFKGIKSFVCNGPFLISSITPNAEIILKKNDKYWNPSQIKLGEIQISIIINETTAWKLFEQEELDWIGGSISPIPSDSIQWISEHYCIKNIPMAGTTFCTFQNQHPYLSNKNLRRAFSLAINRKEIIEQITQMGETPATRCIPPAMMGFRNKTLYQSFDPERARLHLEKAIKELGVRKEQLNGLILSFRCTQINRQIAQAIQRQWKDTLDLDIELNQCETNILRDRLQRHDYQMALHFWIAQYSDPINILERFQDLANPKNLPGWFNSSFSNCVEAAIHNIDPLDRLDLIETAEQILINEMPLAPIYHWTNSSTTQPWVKNLQSTPSGSTLFERCWISRE